MVTISRRSALGGTLGLVSVAIAQSARAQGVPKEFHVGYQKGGFLSVSKDQRGLERRLKELGITDVKWSEFQFGPPMMEALGAGAIDFGEVGDMPPIFAQAAGHRFVYAARMPGSQHALLVPENSTIRALADIKGKKIALARGSSAHNVTVRLLAKAGLAYSDIVPAYLPPADASAAFSRGSVDAWVVWDPYFALAERRQKARAVATTKEISGGNSFYVANRDFATKYAKVLTAVIEEVTKVTQWAAQNRDKFAEAISAAIGIDLDVELIAIGRADLAVGAITPDVIAQQQQTADVFLELGFLPRKITIRDAVWSSPSDRT
jgi:sulfonate transport system substrate-binding protein